MKLYVLALFALSAYNPLSGFDIDLQYCQHVLIMFACSHGYPTAGVVIGLLSKVVKG